MLVNYPEWARYGAAELKRRYGRNLGIALATSVLIHGIIIAFLFLSAGEHHSRTPTGQLIDLPIPRSDSLRPIQFILSANEGGGGSPIVKAPLGPAVKGHPHAVPEQGPQRDDPKRSVRFKTATKMRPSKEETKPSAIASSDSGQQSAPVNGTAGDRPDGRGVTPASGGGGVGIGSASGLGGRGWVTRPRPRYPHGANVEGTVVLRFTVMPNGDIVNISTIKLADPALVNSAVSALRRSRARPLPLDAPQVAVTGTIPIHFKLDD